MSNDPKENKNKPTSLSVWAAIILCFSIGILVTIGGFQWAVIKITELFKISYSTYAMVLIYVFMVSELWALLIQIPAIRGYGEIISARTDRIFKRIAIFLFVFLMSNTALYISGDDNHWFHILLTKGIYKLSGIADNNDYEQRLDILNDLISREGVDSEKYAERGKMYFDIGMIKKNKDTGYETLLTDHTVDECFRDSEKEYENAIKGLEDNLASENVDASISDQLSQYYYQRGNSYLEFSPAEYKKAKDDFEKAIELKNDNEGYYYKCAKAWYYMEDDGDNETYDNALRNMRIAIGLHLGIDNVLESPDIDYDKQQQDTDISTDEVLAEYYYYEGLIYKALEEEDSLNNEIFCFGCATQYDDNNADYFSELGRAYCEFKDANSLEAAKREFDHAIDLNKIESDYDSEAKNLVWKAHTIEMIDDKNDEALDLYNQAVSLRRDYPYAYRRMADIYANKGDKDNAFNVINSALKNCQDNSEFYYKCGAWHYEWLMDYTHTIDDMNNALQGNYSSFEHCYWYIASSYYCQGKYNEAYDNYILAIKNGYNAEAVKEYMEYCEQMMDNETE